MTEESVTRDLKNMGEAPWNGLLARRLCRPRPGGDGFGRCSSEGKCRRKVYNVGFVVCAADVAALPQTTRRIPVTFRSAGIGFAVEKSRRIAPVRAARNGFSSLPLAATFVGLAAGLGLSIPLARGDARASTIATSEIKEGMKGYGLTVFHGTRPERFDVEVIGVLHNFRPSQDLILIKTPNNARLDAAKGVHGMSGSPIYLDDGRLAGAYSYLLASFPAEPVAGVTPIAPMLAELHRPIPPGFWPIEGGAPLPVSLSAPGRPPIPSPAPGGATSFEGPPGGYDLEEHAAQIARRVRGDQGGFSMERAPCP